MSVTYEIVEDVAFFLNHHVNGCVKKIMHNFITSSSNCEELPLWIYLQLKVKKYRYKDFPIYVMRRKNNINAKKAILFLAGGGGMARPMFLHFDIVLRRCVTRNNYHIKTDRANSSHSLKLFNSERTASCSINHTCVLTYRNKCTR